MTNTKTAPRRVPADQVINFQGNDFVKYEGLLALAHEDGLSCIDTQILQIPSAQNGHVAIVHATVTTTKGTYEGIGDASPDNVNRQIAPHLVRQAETRAKARALRDATNIGMTAIEELAGHDDAQPAEPAPAPQPKKPADAYTPPSRPDRTRRGATPEQLAEIDRLSEALGLMPPVHPLSPQEAETHIHSLTTRLAGQAAHPDHPITEPEPTPTDIAPPSELQQPAKTAPTPINAASQKQRDWLRRMATDLSLPDELALADHPALTKAEASTHIEALVPRHNAWRAARGKSASH